MAPRTNRSAYRKHTWSGGKRKMKQVAAAMQRYHNGATSRAAVWRKKQRDSSQQSLCDLTDQEYPLECHDTVIIDRVMESKDFANISLADFKWLNEPKHWIATKGALELSTDDKTDFWQKTLYGFEFNTGHIYGVDIKDDFTFEVCVEAEFTTLYDQAGLMIYLDEKHWLKTGIEYNDGQPMIGSILTNEVSDWATGVFTGNPRKFYIRLTRVASVVCVKYSTDNVTWQLLRLCPFPVADKYFVGLMCCTPKREGLEVKFSNLSITKPVGDILHSN